MKLRMLLPILMLGGCVTTQPIAMSTTAIPTDPNVSNGDVLAAQREAGVEVPALRGQKIVTVRSYHYDAKTVDDVPRKVEITDVQCEVQGDGYTAQITTPAQVRVPDYGYASRPITLNCAKDGYKNSVANLVAFDADKQGRMRGVGRSSVLALVTVAVINAVDDTKNNNYEYPVAEVLMNRVGCETGIPRCRAR